MGASTSCRITREVASSCSLLEILLGLLSFHLGLFAYCILYTIKVSIICGFYYSLTQTYWSKDIVNDRYLINLISLYALQENIPYSDKNISYKMHCQKITNHVLRKWRGRQKNRRSRAAQDMKYLGL